MEIRLEGQVAIVTGSSQGIGRAAAELLAECGAAVVLNSHSSRDKIEAVAEDIRAKGGKVIAVAADASDRVEAQKLVDAAIQLGGRIDILVNNTGGLVKRIPVAEFDEAHFQKVIDINLRSAFMMSHLVLPHMKKQKFGKIINLSSQAAHDGGGAGSAVYSASKGAIWTFTKSLAKEVAPFQIEVNCISPGFIGQTLFHDTFTAKEVHEKVKTLVPLGRHGTPDDVARLILFVASDLCRYITGQSFEINGGLLMY